MPFGVPSTRTARTPLPASRVRPSGHEPPTAELGVPAAAGGRAAVTAGAVPELIALLAPALGVALALVAAWLIVDPHTPDLAAQVYRVGLFRQLGLAVWDDNWYAGHHLPGYSLLFPPLGTLIGVRAVGALCVPVSTALFGLLAAEEYGRGARWGAIAFALAAAGDVWLGRLAFALGVSVALGAALAMRRGHPLAAGLLAALAAAASPVAGVLLGLAALTVAIAQRSPRALLVLAAPAALVVVPLAALFPEGGWEPFPILSFLATAGAIAAFALALPPRERVLRLGALVYLAACVLFLVLHSPVGSNIERYGVLLGAPLLICALLRGGRPAAGPRGMFAGALALAAIFTWVLWGPVRETAAVAGNPATSPSYYRPLERFLASVAGPVRVEVPLTRSHWEAAMLAPRIELARGWEKQLDTRYDRVLFGAGLDASSYREWLDREAISYVAVPDVAPDPSSVAENRLIDSGLPYLRPVFASSHWRVYRVAGANPLASGAGRLTELGHDTFAVRAEAAGAILVRVHFSRYWTVTAGTACVGRGPEGFTEVRAAGPGAIRVAARFSLARAFGSGPSCRR